MEVAIEKSFGLGVVLSVTTGRLMCPIGEVYDILNWMTGDNLFTHQLPRAADECAPYLIKRYPFLPSRASAETESINPQNVLEKLSEFEEKWGKELMVPTIPQEAHEVKDPITKIKEMNVNAEIIAIVR